MQKISIVMPTYNRGYILEKSINSILRQTHKEFELLIIDDLSTDNTEEIVKTFKDSRIVYIKLKKNQGANRARNIGVEYAKYDIIAFQDSDDEWYEDKLKKQLNYLLEGNYDVVCCKINQYLNNKFKRIFPEKNIDVSKNLLDEVLLENFMSTQTILGKKECFLEEKFDNALLRFQDWELAIRLVHRYKIGFYNSPLVNVFIQNDSISKDSKKAKCALKQIYKKHFLLINKNKVIESEINKKIYLFSILNNGNSKYYIKKSLKLSFNLLNLCLYIISIFNLGFMYKKYHAKKWG